MFRRVRVVPSQGALPSNPTAPVSLLRAFLTSLSVSADTASSQEFSFTCSVHDGSWGILTEAVCWFVSCSDKTFHKPCFDLFLQ